MTEDALQPTLDPQLAALQPGAAPRAGRSELYRDLLSRFPAGVTVVTAFDERGEPRGLTLIAFCGVSLEPPLVLVCVDRNSNTLPAIRHSGGFTVNFISSRSDHVARLMATKSADKFERIPWKAPGTAPGGPILDQDSTAHLVCKTVNEVLAGDHWVFLGEVLDGGAVEGAEPLVFHRREFRDLLDDGG
ncbi:MAG TPA: flavin reductase family protein [Candidatus Dormibacteraeota bacterium]|nr:flavin reductase family protein [Candidatus Dormibacteraeota bacterium]